MLDINKGVCCIAIVALSSELAFSLVASKSITAISGVIAARTSVSLRIRQEKVNQNTVCSEQRWKRSDLPDSSARALMTYIPSSFGGRINNNEVHGNPQPRKFYGWVIVLVSALLGFLGTGFYSYSRGMFLPHLANTLDDGNRFSISMGFSCAVITGALVAPYLGRYLDHGSPKKIMLGGIAIVSASYLMLAHVSNLLQFYFVVSVCMGLGMATMGGPGLAPLGDELVRSLARPCHRFCRYGRIDLGHRDAALGQRDDRSHRLAQRLHRFRRDDGLSIVPCRLCFYA
jgi:hypothetical protein